jgi:hypothetical protein
MDSIAKVECSKEDAFWVHDGTIVFSVEQLITALKYMTDFTFKYHVNANNNKNDFADWIRRALLDEALALELENILEKKKYSKILQKHL